MHYPTPSSTFDDALRHISPMQRDVKPEEGRSPNAIRLHLVETDQPRLEEQGAAVRAGLLAQLRALLKGEAIAPIRKSSFTWTLRLIVGVRPGTRRIMRGR